MRSDCRPRNSSPSASSSFTTAAPPSTDILINSSSPPLLNPIATQESRDTSDIVTPSVLQPIAFSRLSRDPNRLSKEEGNIKKNSTARFKLSKTSTPTYPSSPLVLPPSTAAAASGQRSTKAHSSVVTEWQDGRSPTRSGNQLKQQHTTEANVTLTSSVLKKRQHKHQHFPELNTGSSVHSHIQHIVGDRKRDSKTVASPSGERAKSHRSRGTERKDGRSSTNSGLNLSSVSPNSSRSRRQMGGCVTRGAVAANIIDASALPPGLGNPGNKTRTIDPSASTDMSLAANDAICSPPIQPADTPNVGSSPGGDDIRTLKNRERRRLSLSQSDPVRPDTGGDNFRGHLLIDHVREITSPITPGLLTQSQIEQLSQAAATAAKNSSEDESNSDIDDDASLPSSDEEAARREKEEKAHAAEKNGTFPVSGGPQRCGCGRLSVSGLPSVIKQDNFENKRQEVKSDTGFFDANTLLGLGVGYACKKGLKPESPNQDDFFIVRIDDWGLYGVFDGHGPYGHDVSNFVQRELPKLIYNDANFLSNPKEALRQSFVTVHQMLELAAATRNLFDCSLSGSTATVVLHRKTSNKLYIAHVGDSRCVLGRLSKDGRKIEAVDLTTDHKPNSESEKKRIVASGGQVRRLEGDIPYRVFLKGRLYPGLAMSRAIGDTVGAQAGVICEPDVNEYTINTDRDLFITLCSDGVWEFLSSSDVAEVVHFNGIRGVQTSADIVARESWNRWIQEEGNVVDDITSEVIYLNPEHAVNHYSPPRR